MLISRHNLAWLLLAMLPAGTPPEGVGMDLLEHPSREAGVHPTVGGRVEAAQTLVGAISHLTSRPISRTGVLPLQGAGGPKAGVTLAMVLVKTGLYVATQAVGNGEGRPVCGWCGKVGHF